MANPTRATVLIVDDAAANLTVVTSALKDSFATRVATNGERALAIANSEHIDLILLDVSATLVVHLHRSP